MPKNRPRPGSRGLERRPELFGVPGRAHPDPAAAGRGLHHDRVTNPGGFRHGGARAGHRLRAPRGDRHARLGHQVPCVDLVAHLLDRIWRRADPDQAPGQHLAREPRALGQESVAGMNGLRAGPPGRREHGAGVEVALARAAAGRSAPPRPPPGRTAGRRRPRSRPHRPDAHAARRGDNPAGDLTPVRHEDGIQHAGSLPAGTCRLPATLARASTTTGSYSVAVSRRRAAQAPPRFCCSRPSCRRGRRTRWRRG